MESVQSESTRTKVIQLYRDIARKTPQYTPMRMAELAPGIVAVEDRDGECDAYFEKEQWGWTYPKLWEQPGTQESAMLRQAGLNVLQGIGRAPQVSTIEMMVDFAKDHLAPRGDQTWHEAPLFFEF